MQSAYSKWSGTHNYAGTKAKRIASFTAEQLVGLAPGAGIKVALFAYDVADAFKTKKRIFGLLIISVWFQQLLQGETGRLLGKNQ